MYHTWSSKSFHRFDDWVACQVAADNIEEAECRQELKAPQVQNTRRQTKRMSMMIC